MNRTIIVGDIHGCYDELMLLLDQVNLTPEDLLIAVGDIVDRGNKSLEVYRYLRHRPNTVVLMGNHERKHLNGILSYSQEIVRLQFGPEYPEFIQWLKTLPYYYVLPEAIIVHAALENGKPMEEQREEVLCGTISGEKHLERLYEDAAAWPAHYTGDRAVLFGHRVVEKPLRINNTWALDTGCCHGQQLTAITLPDMQLHQVQALSNHWQSEIKRWQLPVLESRKWRQMEMKAIRHQLKKLDFVNEPEVKVIVEALAHWAGDYPRMLERLKERLDTFTADLKVAHPDDFVNAVQEHAFKNFLFKSAAGQLKLSDLENSLNTPVKVLELALLLEMEVTPFPL
ncbi:serine/threonine protein phosphatase 1 [Chitinophaga jiangningensis]|uniref:Serine/threonine protein phosphatase 1 n=1 Tax=Chitinophaga jiangningensis TaxID=1419482 RepID=A0A1M7MV97_9BACT|nr:metallophosphoesterase [Chitinophaga jiangningensis]SHM94960.1 serine/threonine protein phosphatase 1 [Chitinophaga jiangningensis]